MADAVTLDSERRKLNVQFDCHHCRLSDGEQDKLLDSAATLDSQVAKFPFADLHVLIEHNARSNDHSVKLSLLLPGTTLVASDHDAAVHPAFERALQAVEDSLKGYKDGLGQVPERQKQEKGTHQDIEPTIDPSLDELNAAVAAGDYTAFRTATFGYEDSVRARVGRWVERYPGVQARIGKGLLISDIVEEVFLDAFEGYEARPVEKRFGDWLESLIDPAVKEIQHKPDEELENVRAVQSARLAEAGPDAV